MPVPYRFWVPPPTIFEKQQNIADMKGLSLDSALAQVNAPTQRTKAAATTRRKAEVDRILEEVGGMSVSALKQEYVNGTEATKKDLHGCKDQQALDAMLKRLIDLITSSALAVTADFVPVTTGAKLRSTAAAHALARRGLWPWPMAPGGPSGPPQAKVGKGDPE